LTVSTAGNGVVSDGHGVRRNPLYRRETREHAFMLEVASDHLTERRLLFKEIVTLCLLAAIAVVRYLAS
jgi:hypothetical protein